MIRWTLAILALVIACLWHAHVTIWLGSLPVATVPALAAIGFWVAVFAAGLSLFVWYACFYRGSAWKPA